MKECKTCGEEFADKYLFCPIDGSELWRSQSHLNVAARPFNPTIIEDVSLPGRLTNALHFHFDQFRDAWPEIKSDPATFLNSKIRHGRQHLVKVLRRPYVISGSLTAHSRDLGSRHWRRGQRASWFQ
jgi:hypothetical protein